MTTLTKRTEESNADLKNHFIELAAFNNWADYRVIKWLNQITDEQWSQVAVSSFGSIRDTAVHIVSAKKIWLDFWTNAPNPIYLSAGFTGTREQLLGIWEKASTELTSFIENYPKADFGKEINVLKPNGELITMEFRKTLPHMVNHSTYHRGQLVTLLRQAGFSDFSNTDLFTYYLSRSIE
jgi:uncharacterized damage-inducible protein DinB